MIRNCLRCVFALIVSAPVCSFGQCPGGVCGASAGIGFTASSYSFTSAWPGSFVTPSYVTSVPFALSYAVPARLPYTVRRRVILEPALPVVAPAVNVFDPPILFPIP